MQLSDANINIKRAFPCKYPVYVINWTIFFMYG